jgi:predicted enzyme related to lactoylglutathione lyase
MNNGEHVIGLFQGMFEKNMLTFTPGWDSNAGEPDDYTHVRDTQRRVKEQGVELTSEVDEITVGPASFTAIDPDGTRSSLISTCETNDINSRRTHGIHKHGEQS